MPAPSSSVIAYQISVSTDIDLPQLQQDWLHIESTTHTPFFLTWAWVSTWLSVYSPHVYLIKAELKNQTVAIGLFTSSTERRHFVINAKQLRLNQTGNTSEDQIWVEYNDFICLNEHKEQAISACFKHLINSKLFHSQDEIIISMILQSRAEKIVADTPNSKILLSRSCYSIDLEKLNKPYLQSLKSNTRYQIRRSIRHYEDLHGELSLIHACSSTEAVQFFKDTAPLHIQRWYDSGYTNPDFVNFHEHLIKAYFDKGKIQLIKVKAGDTVIAILYYLINQCHVSFYLHGLLYEDDKKLKPGLVAHSLATQYFIDQKMKSYDYMGGYSQYKAQLASRSEDLSTIRIQKPLLKFILENTAQTIKNIVSREA